MRLSSGAAVFINIPRGAHPSSAPHPGAPQATGRPPAAHAANQPPSSQGENRRCLPGGRFPSLPTPSFPTRSCLLRLILSPEHFLSWGIHPASQPSSPVHSANTREGLICTRAVLGPGLTGVTKAMFSPPRSLELSRGKYKHQVTEVPLGTPEP